MQHSPGHRTPKKSKSPAKTPSALEGVQAKLKIGAVNDPAEAEADAMADAVMAGRRVGPARHGGGGVRRECAACEAEDETVRRKATAEMLEEEEGEEGPTIRRACARCDGGDEEVQRKESSAGRVGCGAEAVVGRARGMSGRPMEKALRSRMETGFGRDFGSVRIHTGSAADSANRSIGARAFTAGRDVFFGSGQFSPGTQSGQRLIAHELAHVVQGGEALRRAPLEVDEVVRQILSGTVLDSVSMNELLREFSSSRLRRLRSALQRAADEPISRPEEVLISIESALAEVKAALHGSTLVVKKPRCDAVPPTVPAQVWQQNPRLEEVRSGRAMRPGERGFGVKLVQLALRRWGCADALLPRDLLYPFGADEVYGATTKAAVRSFQRERQLSRDGVVGPITLAELGDIAVSAADNDEPDSPGSCPPRLGWERGWDQEQSLKLESSVYDKQDGHVLRKWVLSGFPIDYALPLPSQGSVPSILKPLYSRAGKVGVLERENGPRPSTCMELHRKFVAVGTGDCLAPERNPVLTFGRASGVWQVWPQEFRRGLLLADEKKQADLESSQGKYPAGTNATPQDRAENRGVAFYEFLFEIPRDSKLGEFERKRRESRVKRDFELIFLKGADLIENPLLKCMIGTIEFDTSGVPKQTAKDQYVLEKSEIEAIRPNRLPSRRKSRFLGETILAYATAKNIWMSRDGDEPLTFCGNEKKPPADPSEAMKAAILDAIDDVQDGKARLVGMKEGNNGEAIRDWLGFHDKIGGLYSCYEEKGIF